MDEIERWVMNNPGWVVLIRSTYDNEPTGMKPGWWFVHIYMPGPGGRPNYSIQVNEPILREAWDKAVAWHRNEAV